MKRRRTEAEAPNDGSTAAGELLKAAWLETLKEPTKLAGAAYLWLVAVGFAHLFGSGMAFGLNVIDLASPGDFLVSGLRNPFVIVLAVMTGWALYRMWGRARSDSRARRALLPTAFVLLVTGSVLSGLYRKSVVEGNLACTWMGPRPLAISLGEGEPLVGYRLAVATSDFLVFGGPQLPAIILSKDSVKQMTVRECKSSTAPSANR